MNGIRLLVDGRPLARGELPSLGLLLEEILPRLSKNNELIILSDARPAQEILGKIGAHGSNIYCWGRPAAGAVQIFKYHLWMRKMIKRLHPDLFWQMHHFLLHDISPVPSIVTAHDIYPLSALNNNLILRLKFLMGIKRTVKYASVILTPSQFTKRNIQQFFNLPGEKIKVITWGLPASAAMEDGVKPTGLPEDIGPFFLFIGRLSYWKGTDILFEMAEKGLMPKGYSLVLAGRCQNEMRKRLRRILDKHKNVIYLGYVRQGLNYLIRKAALFLYPSRYDGFGLPPLEAAIRKCPILMSNIEILKEVTKDSGDYFDINSGAEGLAVRVNEILNRSETEMAKKLEAMYSVARGYTWERHMRELETVIDGVLNPKMSSGI